MLKLQADKMRNSIERAKALHPKVRVISADERTYAVMGSKGDWHTVRFILANGHKLAECACVAGRRGQLCYHVAAAAAVNIGIQSMRQSAPTLAESEAFISRNLGWML